MPLAGETQGADEACRAPQERLRCYRCRGKDKTAHCAGPPLPKDLAPRRRDTGDAKGRLWTCP